MAPSEPSSPIIASPGYPNTPEEQDLDLKSHDMMLIGFQEEHNNSLKEVQENMRQQIEVQKKETQKFLKIYTRTWVERYKPIKRKHKNH